MSSVAIPTTRTVRARRRTEVFADYFAGSELDFSNWQFESPPNTFADANHGQCHFVTNDGASTRIRLTVNTPGSEDSELMVRWAFEHATAQSNASTIASP